MSFRRLVCVAIALTALLAMSAGSLSTAAAAPAADAVAAKKKKSCKGKKGKKGKGKARKGTATAAKKKKGCKKGKKKGGKGKAKAPAGPPKGSGPAIPAGDYVCSLSGGGYAGTAHILPGNRYVVNEGPEVGTYKFFPDTGVMQFTGGAYSWAYGVYVEDSKGFDVYSNYDDGVLQVGDYGWTCYLDTTS